MEDAHLVEQNDCDAATFALGDFRSKTAQESFDVLPGDVRAGWVCEDCFQRLLMGALHARMVPEDGTERNVGVLDASVHRLREGSRVLSAYPCQESA